MKSSYEKPVIRTVEAQDVLESLGPVSAGSGLSPDGRGDGGDTGFQVNTNSCGFPMGQPCP